MNSREKGKRGERQWRDELRAQGFEARRGQQFAGSPDSPDVVCDSLPWAHFEVKAVERLNIEDAMEQARRDSQMKNAKCRAQNGGKREEVFPAQGSGTDFPLGCQSELHGEGSVLTGGDLAMTDFPLGCQSSLRGEGSVLTSFKQQNKMRTDPIAGTDTARSRDAEGVDVASAQGSVLTSCTQHNKMRTDPIRSRVPFVAHKRNFRAWLVTMEAETFFQFLRGTLPPEGTGALRHAANKTN